MDNLTYKYNSGNQLKTVTDAGTTEGFKQGSGDYLYDANGNMTVDPNKGDSYGYTLYLITLCLDQLSYFH